MQSTWNEKKNSPLLKLAILIIIVIISVILVVVTSNIKNSTSDQGQDTINNAQKTIENDLELIDKKDEKDDDEVEKDPDYDPDSLIGIFLYEKNNTKYEFKEDGSGSMSSDDYNYEYTYEVDDDIISIDFDKKEVHDVKYSFELKDGVLKLVSEEGTVTIGEEYILKKEKNK